MRLPIVALVVPLIMSGVMWAITGSPLFLLFGLLSPLMLVAHLVDSRIHEKKKQRQEDTHRVQQKIEEKEGEKAQQEEHRISQVQAYPPSSYWAQRSHELRPFWAIEKTSPTQRIIRVGTDRFSRLPVLVDAHAGIAVMGDDIECASVHRSLATQLAWRWGVDEYARCSFDQLNEPEVPRCDFQEKALIVLAHHDRIPPGVRYVCRVHNGKGVLQDLLGLAHSETEVSWDLLTRAEHQRIIDAFSRERDLASHESPLDLPHQLQISFPEKYPEDDAREALPVYVGKSAQFPLIIDLVHDGPHALVVGRTGSGKTEFMRTWIMGMCAAYSPQSLNFLIIDYKGGTGFSDLEKLTHVCGLATDISSENSVRMVTSLKAEILTREKILVENRVSDIAGLPQDVVLARLVVVIDEYRALLDQHPDLAKVISDIASRGRALGMHLILSSQRLSGTISDTIVANCPLRVSFSLSDKAEYAQLFGVPLEREHATPAGRATVMTRNGRLTQSQMAITSPTQSEHLHQILSQQSPPLRIPWIPPLPQSIPWDEAFRVPGKVVLGLADYPEKQTQTWFACDPFELGSVLISGKAHSGKTHLLSLMALQLRTRVISDGEQLWDCVIGGDHAPTVLIDDLDFLIDQMGLEHKEKLLAQFPNFVRQIRHSGGFIAASLTTHSRYETMLSPLWKVVGELGDQHIPGRMLWNSTTVMQVAQASMVTSEAAQHPVLSLDTARSYVVLTSRVSVWEKNLSIRKDVRVMNLSTSPINLESAPAVYVGDVDSWHTHYALLNGLKSHAAVIVDHCNMADLRALRVNVGTLPLCHPGTLVLIPYGGEPQRVTL